MSDLLRAAAISFALLAATVSAPAFSAAPPALLLAERYSGDHDISHYWVSEKLDGVRATWDGKSPRFRSGNPVPAQQWFLDALPSQPLDGRRFSLGSGLSDALRRTPPPVGTQITYRYRELTKNGMPRFPRYLRVRVKL